MAVRILLLFLKTFDVVVVAAAVAKSFDRAVFVVSVALSCHFSVVSRRASKPCPLTFALTLLARIEFIVL